ncbi:MAG: hypothetical protein HYY04_00920 [Chloroflexi bacterium]|nr:hypothetical protein [Chloroflexota bacterium]
MQVLITWPWRVLRAVLRALGRTPSSHYSAEQVLAVLRGEGDAVLPQIERQIAMLPALLGDEEVEQQFQHYPRYFEVLPRIIFQYRRGIPPGEIADNLDFLATEYGVQAVMEITARVLAERLNQVPPRAAFPLTNRR